MWATTWHGPGGTQVIGGRLTVEFVTRRGKHPRHTVGSFGVAATAIATRTSGSLHEGRGALIARQRAGAGRGQECQSHLH